MTHRHAQQRDAVTPRQEQQELLLVFQRQGQEHAPEQLNGLVVLVEHALQHGTITQMKIVRRQVRIMMGTCE